MRTDRAYHRKSIASGFVLDCATSSNSSRSEIVLNVLRLGFLVVSGERLSLLHHKAKSGHDLEVEKDFPDVAFAAGGIVGGGAL